MNADGDPAAKQPRLRQPGALNPTPGEVRDPMVAAGESFDPSDPLQVRYQMARLVRAGDASLQRRHGASESRSPAASG